MSFLNILASIWYLIEFILDSISYLIWGAEDRDEEDVTDKVVVITGGNAGIGKALGMKMAKRGAIVVLACRSQEEGLKAQEDIQYETQSRKVVSMQVDLSDVESIKRFAKEVNIKYPEIHILINNAGVCIDSQILQKTQDGHEIHMMVNHFGHFLLTNLLLENLKRAAPSRVVVVSSTQALFSELDLNDLMLSRHPNPTKRQASLVTTLPYNNSKFANSLFAKELGRRLKGSGVNVYSVCPGLSDTNIFKTLSCFGRIVTKVGSTFIGMSPKKAANSILYCALSKRCDNETGKFYRFEKILSSGNRRLSPETAKHLWSASEEFLRNNYGFSIY